MKVVGFAFGLASLGTICKVIFDFVARTPAGECPRYEFNMCESLALL